MLRNVPWVNFTLMTDPQPTDILSTTNILKIHHIVVRYSLSLVPGVQQRWLNLQKKKTKKFLASQCLPTSISRWKSNKSIFCQFEPSSARMFQYLLTWNEFFNCFDCSGGESIRRRILPEHIGTRTLHLSRRIFVIKFRVVVLSLFQHRLAHRMIAGNNYFKIIYLELIDWSMKWWWIEFLMGIS